MDTQSFLKQLNKPQAQAVSETGNTMVLAGPGAGKTRTLIGKVVTLIEQKAVPSSILALTFTTKAAKEMKERVQSILFTIDNISTMTFHGFCARYLRKHIEMIGKPITFSIYDDKDQTGLIRAIIKRGIFDKLEGSAHFEIKQFKMFLSNFKDTTSELDLTDGVALEQLEVSPACQYLITEYEKELHRNNACDFSDLIRYAIAIIEMMPETISQYEHVLIDEYHDSNHNQIRLVELFSRQATLFAVADADQVIYGWRGSKATAVSEFTNQFNAKQFILENNYRSIPAIVNASTAVIKHNQHRINKGMHSKREGDSLIYNVQAKNMYDEAEFIASQSHKIISQNEHAKVGILYRQNRYVKATEIALNHFGINYHLHKGIEFTQRKEIAVIIRIFRFLTNPHDTEALSDILNHLETGFGAVTMAKISSELHQWGDDELILSQTPSCIQNKKKEAYEAVMALIMPIKHMPLVKIEKYFKSSGLLEKCSIFTQDDDDQKIRRLDNIKDFFFWISIYLKDNPNTDISQFVQDASLDTSSINSEDKANVHLMTVHSSKGLEFTHVFIAGATSDFFPGKTETPAAEEEARRLYFVAMTRAKDMLYMLSPQKTFLNKVSSAISPYIYEIPKHLIKKITI